MRAWVAVIFLLGTVGCAHSYHPDVRPGPEGRHRVLIEAEERYEAEREAIRQARNYCRQEQNDSQLEVLEEETRYQGVVDEDARQAISAASRQRGVRNRSGRQRNRSRSRGPLGWLHSFLTSDEDYETEMVFGCHKQS